jgi:hypothetical protein
LRAKFNNLRISVITVPALLIMLAGLSACGGSSSPTTTTPPSTVVSTATKKAASTVSTSAPVVKTTGPVPSTPVATPKLNDIAFTLALDPGQQYTEATTSIFLKSNQILHMNWLVVKGGNYFYLTFTLPDGNVIAVRSNGSLESYPTISGIPQKLSKTGGLVVKPSDRDWTDGYYIFHSQLYTGDVTTAVKLIYWIEG